MIKKLIITVNLIVFLSALSACGTNSEDNVTESYDLTITPAADKSQGAEPAITQAAAPDITSSPAASEMTPDPGTASSPEETSDPEDKLTSVISPTGVPSEFISATHEVASNNGKLTATAYTTAERFTFDEVIDKITIQKGDAAVYEISDIIGYYDTMTWSKDDTKIAISYYGKQWGNFIIADVINNTILYPEIYYSDIRKHFEDLGYRFDYEPNASRPDPYIYFDGWSEDSKSFRVKYTVKDVDWLTQSGSFWYNLDTGEMSDFEQYPPYQQG